MRYRVEQKSRARRTDSVISASDADWDSPWIDCRGFRRVEFVVSWTGPYAITGTLSLQGRPAEIDGELGPNVTEVEVPVGASDDGAFGAWPNVTNGASPATVVVENPMSFMRVRFAYGSGGAGAAFRVIATVS
jgi:hypothetical protein